jgi:hypothetical protein
MPAQALGRNGPDGVVIGADGTELVGFYGATPVAQRASALQASSQNSLTTFMTINTNVAALLLEITNTLVALGIWKGSA